MQNGSLECIDRPPSQFLNEFLMVDAPETYILHHHAKFCGDWLVGVQFNAPLDTLDIGRTTTAEISMC